MPTVFATITTRPMSMELLPSGLLGPVVLRSSVEFDMPI